MCGPRGCAVQGIQRDFSATHREGGAEELGQEPAEAQEGEEQAGEQAGEEEDVLDVHADAPIADVDVNVTFPDVDAQIDVNVDVDAPLADVDVEMDDPFAHVDVDDEEDEDAVALPVAIYMVPCPNCLVHVKPSNMVKHQSKCLGLQKKDCNWCKQMVWDLGTQDTRGNVPRPKKTARHS